MRQNLINESWRSISCSRRHTWNCDPSKKKLKIIFLFNLCVYYRYVENRSYFVILQFERRYDVYDLLDYISRFRKIQWSFFSGNKIFLHLDLSGKKVKWHNPDILHLMKKEKIKIFFRCLSKSSYCWKIYDERISLTKFHCRRGRNIGGI